jgi:hypothetical protein
MKRTLLYTIATLALGGMLIATGYAQNQTPTPTPNPNTQGAGAGKVDPGHPRVNEVNAREQNQQNRIANGVKNDKLTPGQAAKLEKQQQHIENQEKKDMAKDNGHLTKADQKQLNKEQNKASKNIYDKKHSGEAKN